MPRTAAHPEFRAAPSAPPAGQVPTRQPAGKLLRATLDSFFAPQFRALENYGAAPEPDPTVAEVIEAGARAIAWHQSEIVKGGEDDSLTPHHRKEIARIRDVVASLTPISAAAE